GVLEFIGRTDNQVKVRGFRVGLEEVEACLALHPSVGATAVCAFEDASGELGLTAFVAGSELQPQDMDHLRRFLPQRLPDYMVPSRFVVVAALPMTPSGKIDRKSLPGLRVDAPRRNTPPHDELEMRLAAIWRELFAADDIGIDDNFFDIGGHSLLAVLL